MPFRFYFFFSSLEQFFPAALCSLYLILFNVFLLRSSLKKEREIRDYSRLKITSIINIILAGLIFLLPNMSITTPYLGIEETVFILYNYILRSLIYTIPQIFTIGLILFLIGSKYESEIGPFLKYSGIFWIVAFTWASISLFNPHYPSYMGLPFLLFFIDIITEFEITFTLTNVLATIFHVFNILGFSFFIVHSYSNNDKNLKIGGFAYIIGFTIMPLSVIPTYFLF